MTLPSATSADRRRNGAIPCVFGYYNLLSICALFQRWMLEKGIDQQLNVVANRKLLQLMKYLCNGFGCFFFLLDCHDVVAQSFRLAAANTRCTAVSFPLLSSLHLTSINKKKKKANIKSDCSHATTMDCVCHTSGYVYSVGLILDRVRNRRLQNLPDVNSR
jgi:hypothetical protein